MAEAAGYTFVPYLEYRKTIRQALEAGMYVPDHMIWPELILGHAWSARAITE